MKILWKLFYAFARVGLFTFGGGYAMLPMLEREVVEKNGWATEEEMLDYYAIGQCTPGVIAVNTATFIGKKEKGIMGAVVATLGVVFPSVVIIIILAAFVSNFAQYETVKYALCGIRVCVCALVANAVIKLWSKAIKGAFAAVIFAVCLLCAVFVPSVPTALLIALSALAGYVFYAIRDKRAKEEKK